MNDLRLKRKGQLQTMEDNRRKCETEAANALYILQGKVDPYSEIANLDTASIKSAAEDLHVAVVEIRKLDEQITAIRNELYG